MKQRAQELHRDDRLERARRSTRTGYATGGSVRHSASVSAQPQPSVYMRARTPPSAHPAPNNLGLVLLLMTLVAIVVAVALVGPGVVGEVRRMADCMETPEQAVC